MTPLEDGAMNDEWREVRLDDLTGIDLRHIRGWQFDVFGSGTVWFDQLACVGDGALFGSSFYNGGATLENLVKAGTWSNNYFQSEVSRNESLATFASGQLSIDYSVEQVESWGEFPDWCSRFLLTTLASVFLTMKCLFRRVYRLYSFGPRSCLLQSFSGDRSFAFLQRRGGCFYSRAGNLSAGSAGQQPLRNRL